MSTRTQAMLAARAKDSHHKRQRVLAAVQALEAAGKPVTATAVATAAAVSTWLVRPALVRSSISRSHSFGGGKVVRARGQREAEQGAVEQRHVGAPARSPGSPCGSSHTLK